MKDMLGNDLAVGESVHVKIGNDWVMGTILKIQNGGLAITGIPKNGRPVGVTPDALFLQVGIGFQGQPGSPQPGLFKISTASSDKAIIESTLEM